MAADTDYPQAVLTWLDTGDLPLLCYRSIQLWSAMHEELSPIVGMAGFSALFCRCVELCSSRHPWLKPAPARSSPARCFDMLRTQLAACAPSEARQASCLLFSQFHALLLVLIGAALTDGVLDAAWRDRPALHLTTPQAIKRGSP